MTWRWPLPGTGTGVPRPPHPGAFGAWRRHDRHTGVDLYALEGTSVVAVEDGTVVGVEMFTGPEAGSPWWRPTWAVLVEGVSGVVVYGEIVTPVQMQTSVKVGDPMGYVARVLKGESRADIPGHMPSMLHIELYRPGTRATVMWQLGDPQPESLLDPTPLLWR